MSQYKECNKAGAKDQRAYAAAYSACISAWGQGVRGEPLRGNALALAEILDVIPLARSNIARAKHQRGLDKLPYEA